MPPIALGTHANLFYSTRTNNTLNFVRYDVTTGKTTQVISIPDIDKSMVVECTFLNDGQWIIFHGVVSTQEALQVVPAHEQIAINIGRVLGNALRESDCDLYVLMWLCSLLMMYLLC